MRARRPRDTFSASGRVLLGVVAVSMLLSGCARVPTDGARTPEAVVVDHYDCLAPNLGGWDPPPDPAGSPEAQRPDAPTPGRVPAGFSPIAAVRCDRTATIEDAEGQWSGVTAVTLTGDLTPLLEALAEPDDGVAPGPCTADMEVIPPLWLVDATGRAILVHYPRNECAKTKPVVHDALAGLAVHGTRTSKRALEVPRGALHSGCAATGMSPIIDGAPQPAPSPEAPAGVVGARPVAPGPIADSVLVEADGMRWCRYAVEPATAAAESAAGLAVPATVPFRSVRFMAGGMLDAATIRAVVDAAITAPVSRSCGDQATTFLVLRPSRGGHELGSTITVELDGCELLQRDGSGARALPPDVLAMLTVQTAV